MTGGFVQSVTVSSQGLSVSPVSNQATELVPLADAIFQPPVQGESFECGEIDKERHHRWSLIFNLWPWTVSGSHDDVALLH